jgi:hypothetical protein
MRVPTPPLSQELEQIRWMKQNAAESSANRVKQ